MSLRARLILGMGLVAIVLVATAVIITRATQANLLDQVDQRLVAATNQGPFSRGPGGDPDEGPRSDAYVGIVADGSLQAVFHSYYGSATALADPSIPASKLSGQGEQPFTVGSKGSDVRFRAKRVLVQTNRFGPPQPGIIALPLADVDAAVGRLIRVEIVVTAIILGLLALVTYWVLRLGVRPIKTMTATATAIAGGDLSHRVPEVAPGTEAGELGTALNQMLTKIEDAFDERTRTEARLRRFAADASHELRTPVATVRGYAELYRAGGLEDPNELSEAMRRTEQEAIRMGSLIEDLLLLARLDQGRPLEVGPVDLAALARDTVADARVVHPERQLTAEAPDPIVVQGDDGRLRQVVANLVGNALVHTPPEAKVVVRVRVFGPEATIEVSDDGPGMSQEVAEQAFERFYRADPSRSRHKGGSGLGLSIVDAITLAHGGRAELHTAPGEGTTVRIYLPTG
jgi:two-component system OmpR family sensor kinase